MKTVKLQDLDNHAIAAVVQKDGKTVVRYTDGKEPVVVEGATTSQVMVQMLKRENDEGHE